MAMARAESVLGGQGQVLGLPFGVHAYSFSVS